MTWGARRLQGLRSDIMVWLGRTGTTPVQAPLEQTIPDYSKEQLKGDMTIPVSTTPADEEQNNAVTNEDVTSSQLALSPLLSLSREEEEGMRTDAFVENKEGGGSDITPADALALKETQIEEGEETRMARRNHDYDVRELEQSCLRLEKQHLLEKLVPLESTVQVPIDEGGETEITIDCSTRELEKYENYDEMRIVGYKGQFDDCAG